MGRRSILHDRRNRDAVLETIRSGHPVVDAGKVIGASDRAIRRYADAHPEFAAELEAARAVGQKTPRPETKPDPVDVPQTTIGDGVAIAARIAQKSIAVAASAISKGRRLPKTYERTMAAEAEVVAEDADEGDGEAPPVEPAPSGVSEQRPRKTRHRPERVWSRGSIHPAVDLRVLDAGPDPAELIEWLWDVSQGLIEAPDPVRATAVRKLVDVKLTPMLNELKLQQMIAARRAERAEDAQDAPETSLVILEIPANGTEAPGHAPRPDGRAVLDAEVVE